MLHQAFGALDGRRRHTADGFCGQAFFDARLTHHARRFVDAFRRGRVRRQNDRVARLNGNQDFEDGGRGGIRRRDDAGDHSARAGDLHHVFRFVDDADRA